MQVFLNGPTPASFCLFLDIFKFNFTENCRLQQDSNADRQSRGEHADHLTTTMARNLCKFNPWMNHLGRNLPNDENWNIIYQKEELFSFNVRWNLERVSLKLNLIFNSFKPFHLWMWKAMLNSSLNFKYVKKASLKIMI